VHHFYDPHSCTNVSASQKEGIFNELNLSDVKAIAYVGRLHPPKRVEVLIRAVAETRALLENIQLLVVGSHDGSAAGAAYKRRLRELAVELNLNDAVRFLGYRKDVPAIMAACDLVILPSETESLGMVLLEAWSHNVSTVASDVAGCREVTLASGGGKLCPVGDHRTMARLIQDLIRRPEIRRKLGKSGHAWVKANCDPEVYASRFYALLASLRKKPRAVTRVNG
jgi:glycosyltransferase involved in cell wall biosynthesis